MRCLYCGKILKDSATDTERQSQWHARCSERFFGTRKVPVLDVDKSQLEKLADETVSKGLTVPGVQKKLSLHLSREKDESRLTIVNYPTGFILKPQAEDFPSLPEYEYLAMRMAEITGIRTVPFGLVRTGEGFAYITGRIDRIMREDGFDSLAMEDFCQLDLRQTKDKYRGSYEQCVKIVRRYSSKERLDLSEILLRIIFSFVIGNSDMHLKNFSLIEDTPGSRIFSLSPAYDLLPVNLIMPEDPEELALPLNGNKQNLRRKDFLYLAELCLFDRRSGAKIINRICSLKNEYLREIEDSYLPDKDKERFKELVEERIQRLLE